MTVRAIRKERKRLARARNMERRDGSKLSRREWFAIRRQFNECCAYCSRPALLEQDHVVPVRLGGLATPDNIVPACRSCNTSKCNNEVTGWLRRKRLDERAFLLRHLELRTQL